jgi:hypothetical protein
VCEGRKRTSPPGTTLIGLRLVTWLSGPTPQAPHP